MQRTIMTLALAATASLMPALALADRNDDPQGAGKSAGAQLGPRPFFLVNDMTDSPLKQRLLACTEGDKYKRTQFSIGHRGAALQFPEHTKESYEAAASMGAGIVECDVTFTKDLFEFLKGLTEGKAKGVKAVKKADIDDLATACEKTEWGSNVSEVIETMAKTYGFKVKKSILYAAKSTDLSSEVGSLKAVKPDAMLFASYASDAILMLKTLKAQKAQPKIIWGQNAGFEAPEFRDTLRDDIVGVLTRTVFLPKVAQVKKVAGEVNAFYKEKTGRDFSGASARAFTGLQTWVEVLEKAGSTKPADIQKACNTIKIAGDQLIVPWSGIKFATTGEDIGQNELGTGMIGQYQKDKDGNITLEIAYPFDVATANLIYPLKGF